jgi:hypothetical protein
MAGIPMQSIATTDDNVRINMPDQSLSESKNTILQGTYLRKSLSVFAPSPLKGYGKHRIYAPCDNFPNLFLSNFSVSSKLRGFAINLLAFFGKQNISDLS